jgi:CubicO group peptidase (beta-lactamase class C family)
MLTKAVNSRPQNSFSEKLFLATVALGTSMFAASSCNAVTSDHGTTEPIWPTQGWQTSSPEAEGMDSKELAKLVELGVKNNYDSLLVVRHGKVVVEAYYAPYAAGIPHAANSITKSIIGTLTAIAWKEGLLDSLDHRVLDFFDRHGIANLEARKEAITIQNLLDLTSGMAWRELGFEGTPSSSVTEMTNSPNWVEFVLDRPMSSTPGDGFNYNSGNAQLVSAIITKLTGTSALDYAKAKLFAPLGITDVFWLHDPQGISIGGFGSYLQTGDLAKIGYLYLRNGAWEGKQLLPAAWIEKVNHATVDMHDHWEPDLRYSDFFWALPNKHVYMATGFNGQMIMVFPDLDVVAVTTARASHNFGEFANSIYKAVKSDSSLPADATSAKLLAAAILDVSTQKPTTVVTIPNIAATISGKIYHFPPNKIGVRSLSLVLADSELHYDIEVYAHDPANPGPRFVGPVGLDGLYKNGELTRHGLAWYLEGCPRVYAVKGSWQNDHTLVIDRLVLGQGLSPEQWTLTFDGEKLDLHCKFWGAEFSALGQTGS